MRRISLALALIGAAAAGCGGNKPADKGGARGVAEGTFTITIQNGQDGNSSLAITGGYVTSTPAGLDCGVAPHNVCSFDFPSGATVTLTATASTGYAFFGFAGDCYVAGNVCTISSERADQYVLAMFARPNEPPGAHPNWSPDRNALHASEAQTLLAAIPFTSPWKCALCHGGSLAGAGLAPSCAGCHGGSATVVAPATTATGETCRQCHATQGAVHQATYARYADASTLVATIGNVAVTPNGDGTFRTVVTFSLSQNGQPFAVTRLQQKRYSLTAYNATTRTFDTATAVSFSAAVATATAGTYTVTAARAPYDVTAADTNAFLYFYFGERLLLPVKGHYQLMDNVTSVSRVFGTIDWISTANVSACERCHGRPYMKHGYRAGVVPGLPDLVACKACHTDQRAGVDFNLAMAYDDPLEMERILALPPAPNGEPAWTPEVEELYGYTATTMADTHIAHAKEFLYPQSMANCATCHQGKLDRILTDANFTGTVCKTCHPISNVVVEDEKRAPKLEPAYHDIDWARGVLRETDSVTGVVTELQCNECHNATWRAPWNPAQGAPVFSQLHTGYDDVVYAANGTKYASTITTSIDSASFAAATNVLTVNFSVNGAVAAAVIRPTVVVSLYGFDTKDFLVSGHSSTGGSRNLEASFPTNTTRLQIAQGATSNAFVATANLSTWASLLANGSVRRAEVAILPALGRNQLAVPDNAATVTNAGVTTPNANYNPYLAITGVARTFDLVGNALVADAVAYGKAIVDPAKCNACHDALGTTFHSPAYGSAGVVGCRLCHAVGSGGSHLEMQSRSIDSYVHAIHSMQPFDPGDIDFTNPLAAFRYNHHIESTYPTFTTLACESCHNAGTYDPPSNDRSLPGILSASDFVAGRQINSVASVVTGPAARACGGCHRAALINEDAAAELHDFDAHTAAFGYRLADPDGTGPITTTTILNDVINNILNPPPPAP